MTTKTHLIIVPCHSVWNYKSSDTLNLGQSPKFWDLQTFQHEGNDHLAFIKHGLRAITEMIRDIDDSVVLFSGSQTKVRMGSISEAESYYLLMRRLIEYYIEKNGEELPKEFDSEIRVYLASISEYLQGLRLTVDDLFQDDRINKEEYSLDSFDNLLYSIARFHEITHSYPKHITIVGFEFKKGRFINYHAKAINFPAKDIDYIGIEPCPTGYSQKQLDDYFKNLQLCESRNALELFAKDWFAVRAPLINKKESRNPFNRRPKYKLLDILQLNRDIVDDEEHFTRYIRDRVPWLKA